MSQKTRQLTQDERLRMLRNAIANTCFEYADYARKRSISDDQKRRFREHLADQLLTEIVDVRFIPVLEEDTPLEDV